VTGGIYLDSVNIKKLNPIAYRRNIGIVSQDTELFNGTIEQNIAYGVEEYSQKQLIKYLFLKRFLKF
jgi:ATP-binding cassette subfamily B protein